MTACCSGFYHRGAHDEGCVDRDRAPTLVECDGSANCSAEYHRHLETCVRRRNIDRAKLAAERGAGGNRRERRRAAALARRGA